MEPPQGDAERSAKAVRVKNARGDDAHAPGSTHRLLKDEAYAIIKRQLLEGEEEETYSERALAAQLDLGLGPVRLALERFRAEGLIVSTSSGIRMPEITSREILDFYELRMVIECHVVASLAGCLSAEQARQVKQILADQDSCAATGDTIRYHKLDLEFHAALAAFHGNAEMEHALARLRDKMYRLARRMHRTHPERLVVNAAQHRSIFEAVREGISEEARSRMRTHLDWGLRFTLDPDRRLGSLWPRPEGQPEM